MIRIKLIKSVKVVSLPFNHWDRDVTRMEFSLGPEFCEGCVHPFLIFLTPCGVRCLLK